MAGTVIQGNFPHGFSRLRHGGRADGGPVLLPPHLGRFNTAGGQPLPDAVRQKMESYFRHDFGAVRVHIGSDAAAMGALAFTHGSNIHFARGQQTSPARAEQLLAHELAHVVQQRSGRVRSPFPSGVAVVHDRLLEAEAERASVAAPRHVARARSRGSDAVQPALGDWLGSASMYFRGATLAGAAAGGAVAGPVGAAIGFAVPYAYDLAHLAESSIYEWRRSGGPGAYHSGERHSSWYHPQNMRRRVHGQPGNMTTTFTGQVVPKAATSSQFASERWHMYSKEIAEEHMLSIDPLARFIRTPIPIPMQANRVRFTVRYWGWTTGWSYRAANIRGESCSYVYSNFVSTAANPHDYFLVQHFPQTAASGQPNDTTKYLVSPV